MYSDKLAASGQGDQIEGKWEQLKAQVKQGWNKLTDDDIGLYKNKAEEFYGRVHEKYGIAKEEAAKRMKEYERACGYCSDNKTAA